MNINEKIPSLSYFLRCYFNQDFEVLFGGSDETIGSYRITETVEEQQKMKAEIEYLLSLSLGEAELQDLLLNKIDCSYYYPDEWKSSELWLKHIIKQLS